MYNFANATRIPPGPGHAPVDRLMEHEGMEFGLGTHQAAFQIQQELNSLNSIEGAKNERRARGRTLTRAVTAARGALAE